MVERIGSLLATVLVLYKDRYVYVYVCVCACANTLLLAYTYCSLVLSVRIVG